MKQEIKIRDIGPVEEFAYDLEAYGLHVLHGRQGAGKTTVLRTVQLAVDGRTDFRPSKRDGASRGEGTIAGKTIRIVKQTREEGELTVDGLGDLSISDLHSPNYKDAATRDRHRIQTLVRLAGVKADASLFHGLLGGKDRFDALVPHDALTTDDLVEMGARVKRAVEREAQRVEEREQTALADARAQAALAEAIDTTLPHSEGALQSALEEAIQGHASAKAALATLRKRERDAVAVTSRAEEARVRLEQIGGGVTVAEAEGRLQAADASVQSVSALVERLQAKLDEARRTLREVQAVRDAAEAAATAARREEALHAELHAAIDAASGIEPPNESEILEAEERLHAAASSVAAAKAAVTTGVRVRQALEAQAKSEQHNEVAQRLAVQAKRLREAALDTATVLTQSISRINGCPLRIQIDQQGDPRLVLSTERSEAEPFDELSEGERWCHVVQLAAASNRLIVLPQAAFGELSPSSRMQLHELAKQHCCYILTALADDCELRGEAFESLGMEAAE